MAIKYLDFIFQFRDRTVRMWVRVPLMSFKYATFLFSFNVYLFKRSNDKSKSREKYFSFKIFLVFPYLWLWLFIVTAPGWVGTATTLFSFYRLLPLLYLCTACYNEAAEIVVTNVSPPVCAVVVAVWGLLLCFTTTTDTSTPFVVSLIEFSFSVVFDAAIDRHHNTLNHSLKYLFIYVSSLINHVLELHVQQFHLNPIKTWLNLAILFLNVVDDDDGNNSMATLPPTQLALNWHNVVSPVSETTFDDVGFVKLNFWSNYITHNECEYDRPPTEIQFKHQKIF